MVLDALGILLRRLRREAQRDQHLRSADFFDAENFPKMTFKSKGIERTGSDEYRVVGDLTIRGVTREVAFDTTFEGTGKDPWGGYRVGFEGTLELSRKSFGIDYSPTGIGDDIKIIVAIEGKRN